MVIDPGKRRLHKRIVPREAVHCRVRNDGGEIRVATVVNISEGGMMMSCAEPFVSIGERIDIELRVEPLAPFTVSAQVTASDPHELTLDETDLEKVEVHWGEATDGRFGVRFTSVNEQTLIQLKQFIVAIDSTRSFD